MPSSGETSPYSKNTQVVSKRGGLPNVAHANAVKVDGATPNRWRLGCRGHDFQQYMGVASHRSFPAGIC